MADVPDGTELLDLDPAEVSIVDRAAINRRFVRVKRADGTLAVEEVATLVGERELDRTFESLETTVSVVAKADRKMTRRRRETLYAVRETIDMLLKELEDHMPDETTSTTTAKTTEAPPVAPVVD